MLVDFNAPVVARLKIEESEDDARESADRIQTRSGEILFFGKMQESRGDFLVFIENERDGALGLFVKDFCFH